VVVEGRKLCGSAQFRGRRAFLQHGSLPLVFDVERQARLLGASTDLLAARALGLADCLGRMPGTLEVEAAIERGLADELGIELEPGEPTAPEHELAAELAAALRSDGARWAGASESRCSA
jgi:lipoate-protein ligase A